MGERRKADTNSEGRGLKTERNPKAENRMNNKGAKQRRRGRREGMKNAECRNIEHPTSNLEWLDPGYSHPHSGNAEGGRGKAEIGKAESRKGSGKHPTSNIQHPMA
jgi:hypothetical protein